MPQIVPLTCTNDSEEHKTSHRTFLGQQIQLELDARLTLLSLENSLIITKQEMADKRNKYKVTGRGGTCLFEVTETIEGVSAGFINSRLVVLNDHCEKLCELLSHPELGNGAIRLVRKSTMLGEVVQRQESFSGERYSFPVMYVYASGTYPLFLVSKSGARRNCKCCLPCCLPNATEFQVERVISKRIIGNICRKTSGAKENGHAAHLSGALVSGKKTEEQYTMSIYGDLSGTEKLLLVTSVIIMDFQLKRKTIKTTGKLAICFAILMVLIVLALIVAFLAQKPFRKTRSPKFIH